MIWKSVCDRLKIWCGTMSVFTRIDDAYNQQCSVFREVNETHVSRGILRHCP